MEEEAASFAETDLKVYRKWTNWRWAHYENAVGRRGRGKKAADKPETKQFIFSDLLQLVMTNMPINLIEDARRPPGSASHVHSFEKG